MEGPGAEEGEQSGGKTSDGGGSTRVPLPELESGRARRTEAPGPGLAWE